jgi:hypothetical protein
MHSKNCFSLLIPGHWVEVELYEWFALIVPYSKHLGTFNFIETSTTVS